MAHTPVLDVQTDGQTGLMVACEEGHLHIAQLLLDQGANINATDSVGACMTSLSPLSALLNPTHV